MTGSMSLSAAIKLDAFLNRIRVTHQVTGTERTTGSFVLALALRQLVTGKTTTVRSENMSPDLRVKDVIEQTESWLEQIGNGRAGNGGVA